MVLVKYLTTFGLAAIRQKIALLSQRQEEALHSAGEAAQNDPNSYHDNFEYEESMRQQEMLSQQLRGLWQLLDGASVAPEPPDDEHVAVGHYVVVRRQDSDEDEGYLVCCDGEGALFDNACSAASPMGAALLGCAKGQTQTVTVANRSVAVKVVELRRATAGDLLYAAQGMGLDD
jgi:transcription elongation GreA/GreB family factor